MVAPGGGGGGGIDFGLLVVTEETRADEAFVKQSATSGFVGSRGCEVLGNIAGVGDGEPNRHSCKF